MSWLRSMHARVRAMDPFRADVALAAVFVAASVIEVFAVPSRGDNLAVTVAAAVVAQSSLAYRRRDPVVAAVLFAVPTSLQAVVGGFLTQDTSVHFLAAMLMLYSIGRYADGRAFRLAIPLVLVGSGIALTVESGLERTEYFFWFLCLFSLPALVGRGLRSRAQSELREKTELIRMPEMDGIEATRRIVGADGEIPVKVLMLTTFDLDEYVYDALRAGASGFLLKDVPADQLVAGIRLVAQGDALLAPSVTRRLIQEFSRTSRGRGERPAGLDELTPREVEVFRLLARGMSNAEIAAELIVSETTVKTHVARILMKLEVRDRVQAVVLAYESGVVAPGDAGSGR